MAKTRGSCAGELGHDILSRGRVCARGHVATGGQAGVEKAEWSSDSFV